MMTGFYGKCYRYKDKIIGVCNTLNPDWYMVGFETTGGHKRVKRFALSPTIEQAQAELDEFARKQGLPEVKREIACNDELIANAGELFEIVSELAGFPDEQCMISPLINHAREIVRRIEEAHS